MASLLRLSAIGLAALLLLPAAAAARRTAAPGRHGPLPPGRPAQGRRLRRGRIEPHVQRVGGAGAGLGRHQPARPAQARRLDVYTYLTRQPRPADPEHRLRPPDPGGPRRGHVAAAVRPDRPGGPAARAAAAPTGARPAAHAARLPGQRHGLRGAGAGRNRGERPPRGPAAELRRSRDRALDWLLGQQGADGRGEDTDLTGSVLEALNAGGRRNTPAQARALAYLRSRQNADGGFGGGAGATGVQLRIHRVGGARAWSRPA